VRPVSPSRPSFIASLRALAVVGLVAAGLGLAGCGGVATPPPTFPPGAIVVTAKNLSFDTSQLIVPADKPFSLVLVNNDSDAHNIDIRTKPGFDGDVIFRHDPISSSTLVMDVGPIPAGTYYFICDVHPTMTGTVVVQ